MQYNIDEVFKDIISPERFAELLEDIKIISYRNSIKFQERLPSASSDNGIYRYTSDFYDSWHGGWWTGIYYMAYLSPENDIFLTAQSMHLKYVFLPSGEVIMRF